VWNEGVEVEAVLYPMLLSFYRRGFLMDIPNSCTRMWAVTTRLI
jgi:hypothetical protein